MSLVDDRALMDRIGGGREPPRNLDVEQALIGAVLMNNDVYRRVSEITREEHYSEELHRRIWNVTATLIEKGTVATISTLKTYLGDRDLGGTTMSAYLARLCAEACIASSAPDYAKTIRDLWIRRQIIAMSNEASAVAYDAPVEATAESLFEEFEARLEKLRPKVLREQDGFAPFDLAAAEAMAKAEAAYRGGGKLIGHSTGLHRLDDALAGLQGTDLLILAGRPAMGKTALATNIGLAVARELKRRRDGGLKTGVVGFFSLEMSREQLAQRIMCEIAEVASFRVRRGIASEAEMQRLEDARRALRDLPLKIDHTGGISISSLSARARTLKKKQGLELLIVDYLQLLTGSDRKQKRYEEVTEISGGLKMLAKELEVPIIGLSQLSRDVEMRDDKRPQLRDLRESGSIEQDADTVLFVFREEYYVRKAEPPAGTERHLEWQREIRRVEGVAQVLIPKNRHGPETTVNLGFEGVYTRFMNEPEPRQDEPDHAERGPKPKKAIRISAKGLSALGALRSLNITSAVENKGDLGNVPRGVRPIPYALWREKCGQELLDADRDEAAAAKLMEAIVPELKSAEMIGRGGSKDAAYVWLTDKGQG